MNSLCLLIEPHLTATGCHLPYGLTPATRHKWTNTALNPARQVGSLLDLPTPEGGKAELTLVTGEMVYPTGHRRPLIQVLTQQYMVGRRPYNHYNTQATQKLE